jgi:hypothetical protein
MARAPVFVLIAVLLGGCPPDRVDELQCGVTPRDTLVACPSQHALTKHLRERWGLQASAEITATCVPGRFGGAGWIIDATARDGTSTASALFVLQPSCGALTDAALRPGTRASASYEAIDLDGDGVDEVMVQTGDELEALRVGEGRLGAAGKIRIAYDADGLQCSGLVRYINRPDGGFFVEIDARRSAESDLCLPDGTHRFELSVHGLRRQ